MSKQTINIGASPNDGTGTPLRTSFDYTNQNFTELYTALGGGVGLPGATTQVIFNDGGTNLAGDAGLVYNKTTDALTVAGLVTAGSATITGDLTVDTSTLKVDSTNNRVGIGTATPTAAFDILGAFGTSTAAAVIRNNSAANNSNISQVQFFTVNSFGGGEQVASIHGTNPNASANNGGALVFNTALNGTSTTPAERYRIGNDGTATWSVAGTTAMTLNSTGLGVGATPDHKLQAVGGYVASGKLASASSGDIGGLLMYCSTDNGGRRSWGLRAESASTGILGFWVSSANNTEPFSGSQVMSLDASGNLLVGTTSLGTTDSNSWLVYKQNFGINYFNHATGVVTGTAYAFFGYAGVQIGSITQNGTTGVLYNTTSDYRLKESVKPLNGGLARVNALKPSVYNWKSDGSTGEGFLAHELAEVVPAAVSGEKDAMNADGSIKSQGIDMSRIVPILVAAIQELTARVQTLEAR
jgi:hypothetical protein